MEKKLIKVVLESYVIRNEGGGGAGYTAQAPARAQSDRLMRFASVTGSHRSRSIQALRKNGRLSSARWFANATRKAAAIP